MEEYEDYNDLENLFESFGGYSGDEFLAQSLWEDEWGAFGLDFDTPSFDDYEKDFDLWPEETDFGESVPFINRGLPDVSEQLQKNLDDSYNSLLEQISSGENSAETFLSTNEMFESLEDSIDAYLMPDGKLPLPGGFEDFMDSVTNPVRAALGALGGGGTSIPIGGSKPKAEQNTESNVLNNILKLLGVKQVADAKARLPILQTTAAQTTAKTESSSSMIPLFVLGFGALGLFLFTKGE